MNLSVNRELSAIQQSPLRLLELSMYPAWGSPDNN